MTTNSTGARVVRRPKARLNVRIEQDLLVAVKVYAQREGTTVTSIITSRFEEILKEMDGADATEGIGEGTLPSAESSHG